MGLDLFYRGIVQSLNRSGFAEEHLKPRDKMRNPFALSLHSCFRTEGVQHLVPTTYSLLSAVLALYFRISR